MLRQRQVVETNIPEKGVPLLPVDAFAGYGGGSVTVFDYMIESFFVIPGLEHADFLIKVNGNSMTPSYNSGDMVACRMIYDMNTLIWGRIYVFHEKENGTLMKRLFPDKTKKQILCRSDNDNYPDFSISIDNITHMALVVGGVKFEG